MNNWKESGIPYITPGGDPVWICPKCGGTKHIYGIEHPERFNMCVDCGEKLKYPWEKNE